MPRARAEQDHIGGHHATDWLTDGPGEEGEARISAGRRLYLARFVN
jgi:hypothetical protein